MININRHQKLIDNSIDIYLLSYKRVIYIYIHYINIYSIYIFIYVVYVSIHCPDWCLACCDGRLKVVFYSFMAMWLHDLRECTGVLCS